jgi:hypothetical protein
MVHAIPVRNPDCAFVDTDTGITLTWPDERTLCLNRHAHMVWSLCDGRRSISDLIGLIVSAYPEEIGIGDHVQSILEKLRQSDAVTLLPGDLVAPEVFESVFGPEIVSFHSSSAELIWWLEQIRTFVFGVLQPFATADGDVRDIDLGEEGLQDAKRKNADTARSIGQCTTTQYTGLFDSKSFRAAVAGVTGELERLIPRNGERFRVSGRAYYPAGGGMGWHSNASAPALRVYCTWAETERTNFFRYEDPRNGDLVTLWEPPGWTLKAFRIPPEPYKLWHCVGAGSRRLSLGFRAVPNAPE